MKEGDLRKTSTGLRFQLSMLYDGDRPQPERPRLARLACGRARYPTGPLARYFVIAWAERPDGHQAFQVAV